MVIPREVVLAKLTQYLIIKLNIEEILYYFLTGYISTLILHSGHGGFIKIYRIVT